MSSSDRFETEICPRSNWLETKTWSPVRMPVRKKKTTRTKAINQCNLRLRDMTRIPGKSSYIKNGRKSNINPNV